MSILNRKNLCRAWNDSGEYVGAVGTMEDLVMRHDPFQALKCHDMQWISRVIRAFDGDMAMRGFASDVNRAVARINWLGWIG